ncbi:MAG: hypothetical protein ACLGG7_00940 [Bacteriovoracia bacterium]
MLFRYSVLLTLALACGERSQSIRFGETTRAALITEKGEPERVEKPIEASEVLVYPDNQKFQVTNDIVTAGFRDPSPEEASLLYWRHRFKDCATTFKELQKSETHVRALKELSCPTEGVSVLYDPNTDQVIRVVNHAEN